MKRIIFIFALLFLLADFSFAQSETKPTNSEAVTQGAVSTVNMTAPSFRLGSTLEAPHEVGKLYFKDGKFHFEGDADESARLFLASINRQLPLKRTPFLFAYTSPLDLEPNNLAAGIAVHGGTVYMLHQTIPQGARVGVYGKELSRSEVTHIWLKQGNREVVLAASISPFWFNLEQVTFVLPDGWAGEIEMKAVGWESSSNAVRIKVFY